MGNPAGKTATPGNCCFTPIFPPNASLFGDDLGGSHRPACHVFVAAANGGPFAVGFSRSASGPPVAARSSTEPAPEAPQPPACS